MTLEQVESDQMGIRVRALHEELVGPASEMLAFLLLAVAIALTIATANVINLLLLRTETRSNEFATRLALGAPRSNVLAMLWADGFWLAHVGFAGSCIVALLGV